MLKSGLGAIICSLNEVRHMILRMHACCQIRCREDLFYEQEIYYTRSVQVALVNQQL